MSSDRMHRQVRLAVASPATLDAAIAGLRAPGALTRALAGSRMDATGRLTMVLVGPDGADATWSGHATVDVLPGGTDVRLAPALPDAPSATLRVVEVEVPGAGVP
jgi:hypothetical protein